MCPAAAAGISFLDCEICRAFQVEYRGLCDLEMDFHRGGRSDLQLTQQQLLQATRPLAP